MPEMQTSDLKSELEAAQQLSLSHVGHAESSRRLIQSLHDYLAMLQPQHDDVRKQLTDALGSKSCRAWRPQRVR